MPLAGGVGLRLVGAADRRALARGGAGGILRVVLDGADLGVAPRAAAGEALLDVDAAPSTSTRRSDDSSRRACLHARLSGACPA